jgi:hypothetical protein
MNDGEEDVASNVSTENSGEVYPLAPLRLSSAV